MKSITKSISYELIYNKVDFVVPTELSNFIAESLGINDNVMYIYVNGYVFNTNMMLYSIHQLISFFLISREEALNDYRKALKTYEFYWGALNER